MREIMVVSKVTDTRTKDGRSVKVTLSGFRVEQGVVKHNPVPKLTLGGFHDREEATEKGFKVNAPFVVTIKQGDSILSYTSAEEIKDEMKKGGIEDVEVTMPGGE